MSAPLAIDNVLQVTYGYTVAAQRLLAVLHYRVEVAGTGTDAETQLQTIADRFASYASFPLLTALLAGTGNNVFWDWVKVQKVKPTRTIYGQSEIDSFGSYLDVAGPVNLAMSIEKRSLHVGQSGVGRLQLGGLPATMVGSYIDGAYLAAEATAIANELTALVTITGLGGMALRPCLPAGGANHDYDLWDAIPKPEARTMHRRTVGLGI